MNSAGLTSTIRAGENEGSEEPSGAEEQRSVNKNASGVAKE
jgi:hypothetical protein